MGALSKPRCLHNHNTPLPHLCSSCTWSGGNGELSIEFNIPGTCVLRVQSFWSSQHKAHRWDPAHSLGKSRLVPPFWTPAVWWWGSTRIFCQRIPCHIVQVDCWGMRAAEGPECRYYVNELLKLVDNHLCGFSIAQEPLQQVEEIPGWMEFSSNLLMYFLLKNTNKICWQNMAKFC